MKKLIYTKDLYDSEGDYLYYFLMKILLGCSLTKVSVTVIRIILKTLKSLIDKGTIKLVHAHKIYAAKRIGNADLKLINEYHKYL